MLVTGGRDASPKLYRDGSAPRQHHQRDGFPARPPAGLPGETVRIQVTFSRFPGLYLYHCHILEHEDMGMMRNFRISTPG